LGDDGSYSSASLIDVDAEDRIGRSIRVAVHARPNPQKNGFVVEMNVGNGTEIVHIQDCATFEDAVKSSRSLYNDLLQGSKDYRDYLTADQYTNVETAVKAVHDRVQKYEKDEQNAHEKRMSTNPASYFRERYGHDVEAKPLLRGPYSDYDDEARKMEYAMSRAGELSQQEIAQAMKDFWANAKQEHAKDVERWKKERDAWIAERVAELKQNPSDIAKWERVW
jgi:primosomal protein N'